MSVLHMLPPTTTLSAHLLSAACGCANWLHKAGHVQGHLAHFAFLQTTRGLWPWLLDLNGFSPLACAEEAVVGPSFGMGLGDGLRLPWGSWSFTPSRIQLRLMSGTWMGFLVFFCSVLQAGQSLTPLRARRLVGPCSGMYHWWPAAPMTPRGEEHYAKSSTRAYCSLSVQPFPRGMLMAALSTHSLVLLLPPPVSLQWEDMNGKRWSHLLTCKSGQ